MENKNIKISFVGDIMVEYPLLKEAQKNHYDFGYVFAKVQEKLKDNDCLIGNLETPIAGKMKSYTNELYCFNTPDKFLASLKENNFDILMTSNNHCLDRGMSGLKRTIKKIKESGMQSIGTYLDKKSSEEVLIKNIQGIKVAFISATYGTNASYNKYILSDKNKYSVDVLRDTTQDYNIKLSDKIKRSVKKILYKVISIDLRNSIKKLLKKDNVYIPDAVVDDIGKHEFQIDNIALEKIDNKIKQARKKADIIILMLHLGGQFNYNPGSYSEYIIEHFSKDVDAIICAHPHNVQKIKKINNALVAYSLGNFLISPSTPYLRDEYLPTYSLILHLYFDKKKKCLTKVSYTPTKIVDDGLTTINIVEENDLNIKLFHKLLTTNSNEIKLENQEIFIDEEVL